MSNLAQLMGSITGLVGDLTNLIASAVATFGTHLIDNADEPAAMGALANGIFGVTGSTGGDGLIYWMKNDFIYLVNNLGDPAMVDRFVNFLAALIIGTGAVDPFTWYPK